MRQESRRRTIWEKETSRRRQGGRERVMREAKVLVNQKGPEQLQSRKIKTTVASSSLPYVSPSFPV